MQQIGGYFPQQFTPADNIVPEGHGNIVVFGRSDIHRDKRGSGRGRLLHINQFRVGFAQCVVERHGQPPVEQGSIQTDVMCLCTLPLQVLVSPFAGYGCQSERIGIFGIIGIYVICQFGIHILIAGITKRIAQAQRIYQFRLTEELLVMNVPCHTQRIGRRERIIHSKHRSTVRTHIKIEQITHIICIVTIQIETGRTRFGNRRTRLTAVGIGIGEIRIIEIITDIPLRQICTHRGVVFGKLRTAYKVVRMHANSISVACQQTSVIARTVVVRA